MSWGPFCFQMDGRGEGSEAEAPFKGLYLMVGRVEKGLQLGRVTQKPHNVFGTESEGGNSMGRSFLSLGFWVLGGEQHRGGEKKKHKTSGSVPFQASREGSRRMTGMVLQKGVGGGGGPGPSTEPTRTVALVALVGGPGPSSQPLPRWRGAAPPPRPSAASPSPPPPPTPRCSCCRRPILHVANGGAAQGRPRVRARGSPGPRGRGSGGVRVCAAPHPGARAPNSGARGLSVRGCGAGDAQ